MRRSEVVQCFLDLFESPRYLEIGVDHGETFHELRGYAKVAVDPHFKFNLEKTREENPQNQYFQVTSDDYFELHARPSAQFDVIYVDGLHTYEQTLRDLLNGLVLLSPDGVIVVDDVIPSSYSASLPDLEDVFFLRRLVSFEAADGSWMGDVYKLVFFVASFLQQFSYATVADNHGQMVLWRSVRNVDAHRSRTVQQTGSVDFLGALKEKAIFNHLPCAEILELVSKSRRNPAE